MFRSFVLGLSISGIIFTGIAPAIAADAYRVRETRFDPFSNFNQRPEVVGGVYLRIPFTGGLKQDRDDWRRDEPRIGFALGAQLPNMPRYSTGLSPYAPRVIDLSMGFSGPDSLKLNGISLIDQRIMRAEEGEGEEGKDKKKGNAAGWIVGGVLVVVAASALVVFEVAETTGEVAGCSITFSCE